MLAYLLCGSKRALSILKKNLQFQLVTFQDHNFYMWFLYCLKGRYGIQTYYKEFHESNSAKNRHVLIMLFLILKCTFPKGPLIKIWKILINKRLIVIWSLKHQSVWIPLKSFPNISWHCLFICPFET